MARIRTIKPEFFTSEDIVGLSPMARLLYIALWCEADREGRMSWKPKTFKMRYFPGDNCDIDALCGEIVDAGLVIRYADSYAYIPSFSAHQHINPRETQSSLPSPTQKRDASARVKHASAPVSDVQGGREGREGDSRVDPPSESTPVFINMPLVGNEEHPIRQAQVDEWSEAYPIVDVPQKLREMRQWCLAKPANRKTQRGINSFIVRWLGAEQDKGSKRVLQTVENAFAGAI